MNTNISQEILTDIEQDKMITLAQDTVTFNALKKYILAVVYKHGVIQKGIEYDGTVNYALNIAAQTISGKSMPHTDEELGQNLRALTYATSLVESGFKEISELRKPEPEKEVTNNPAE